MSTEQFNQSSNICKMFIGGLNPTTSEGSLRQYFIQFGDIQDLVIMRDKDQNTSRGFGFVTFTNNVVLTNVLRRQPHIVDGKQVDCKPAVPKDQQSSQQFQMQPQQPSQHQNNLMMQQQQQRNYYPNNNQYPSHQQQQQQNHQNQQQQYNQYSNSYYNTSNQYPSQGGSNYSHPYSQYRGPTPNNNNNSNAYQQQQNNQRNNNYGYSDNNNNNNYDQNNYQNNGGNQYQSTANGYNSQSQQMQQYNQNQQQYNQQHKQQDYNNGYQGGNYNNQGSGGYNNNQYQQNRGGNQQQNNNPSNNQQHNQTNQNSDQQNKKQKSVSNKNLNLNSNQQQQPNTQKAQQQKLKQQTMEFQKQLQKQNILIKEQEMQINRLQSKQNDHPSKESGSSVKDFHSDIQSNQGITNNANVVNSKHSSRDKDNLKTMPIFDLDGGDEEEIKIESQNNLQLQAQPQYSNSSASHLQERNQQESLGGNQRDQYDDNKSVSSRRSGQSNDSLTLKNLKTLAKSREQSYKRSSIQSLDTQYRKIFVGGLPHNLSDEEFRAFFAKFGDIEDCAILKDKRTGKPRGFGFVTYSTVDQVDYVMNIKDQHHIQDKWVDCKRAVPANVLKEEIVDIDKINRGIDQMALSQNNSNHSNSIEIDNMIIKTPIRTLSGSDTQATTSPPINAEKQLQDLQNLLSASILKNPQLLNSQFGLNLINSQIQQLAMQQLLNNPMQQQHQQQQQQQQQQQNPHFNNQMNNNMSNMNNMNNFRAPNMQQQMQNNNMPQNNFQMNPQNNMQQYQLWQQQQQLINQLNQNYQQQNFNQQQQQQPNQYNQNPYDQQQNQFQQQQQPPFQNQQQQQMQMPPYMQQQQQQQPPFHSDFNSHSQPFKPPSHNSQNTSQNSGNQQHQNSFGASGGQQHVLQNQSHNSSEDNRLQNQTNNSGGGGFNNNNNMNMQDNHHMNNVNQMQPGMNMMNLFNNNQQPMIQQNSQQDQSQQKSQYPLYTGQPTQPQKQEQPVQHQQNQQENQAQQNAGSSNQLFSAPATVSIGGQSQGQQQTATEGQTNPQPSAQQVSPQQQTSYQNSISGFPSFQYLNGQFANQISNQQPQSTGGQKEFKSGFPYSQTFKFQQQQQQLQDHFNNSLNISGIGLNNLTNQSLNDSIGLKQQEQTEWFIQSLQNQYESSFSEDINTDQKNENLNKKKKDTISSINQQIQKIQQKEIKEEEKVHQDRMNQIDWKQTEQQNNGNYGGFFTSQANNQQKHQQQQKNQPQSQNEQLLVPSSLGNGSANNSGGSQNNSGNKSTSPNQSSLQTQPQERGMDLRNDLRLNTSASKRGDSESKAKFDQFKNQQQSIASGNQQIQDQHQLDSSILNDQSMLNHSRRHILGSGENFQYGKDRPSSRSSQDKNSNIKSEYGQIKSLQKQGPSNRADRNYKPY